MVDTTYIIIAEADRENVDDPPKKIPFSNRRWMLLGVGLLKVVVTLIALFLGLEYTGTSSLTRQSHLCVQIYDGTLHDDTLGQQR